MMNAKISIVVVAAVAIGIALGVAWSNRAARQTAEIALLDLAKKNTRAADESARLETRRVAAEQEKKELRTALEELRAAKAKAVPAPPSAKEPPAKGFNPMEAINQDPKLQNYFIAAQRARLATTYGPLVRQLGLTPSQTSRLQDLLIKRTEQEMDLQAVAQSRGLAPKDPALAALRKQSEDEIQVAASALLGPAFEQFQQYERTVEVREIAQRFVGAAVLEDMPITAQQTERLVDVFANASSKYRSGAKASFPDVDWAVVDRELAPVLSESQLKLFRGVEPLGGGPSRFMARFSVAFQQAVQAEKKPDPSSGDQKPQE